jgi:hypothetical protein
VTRGRAGVYMPLRTMAFVCAAHLLAPGSDERPGDAAQTGLQRLGFPPTCLLPPVVPSVGIDTYPKDRLRWSPSLSSRLAQPGGYRKQCSQSAQPLYYQHAPEHCPKWVCAGTGGAGCDGWCEAGRRLAQRKQQSAYTHPVLQATCGAFQTICFALRG